MAHVSVTVAGRIYRMACGEGEEARIAALARTFDGKIGEFKAAVGDIGEMRLHVMAGLFFTDEVEEMGRRLAAAEVRLAALEGGKARDIVESARREAETVRALAEAARRIEGLSRLLTAPVSEE